MKQFRFMIFILFTVALTGKNFGQNTYDFLRLDMSPRAAAVAGSFVSNSDDPNVIFYNPAGINNLENFPVSISYFKHLLDINITSLAAARQFGDLGHFALGVQYINYGTFTKADQYANKLGEFGAGEMAFTLGYGNQLDNNFFYGVNAKFIYSGIEDYSSSAFAFDLGLQYLFPASQFTIGFSALNMGSQISSYVERKEDLPLDVRIGASKKLEHLPLKLYLSFNKLNQDQDKVTDRLRAFSFGGEFTLSKALRLRLGYDNEKRREMKIGTTTGFAGFNLGLGLVVKSYNFDYSYSSLGLIGSLHRIGISTTFQ